MQTGASLRSGVMLKSVYFSIVFTVFLYWVIFLDFTYYTRMIRYMAGSGPLAVVDIRFAVGFPARNSSPPPSGCLSSQIDYWRMESKEIMAFSLVWVRVTDISQWIYLTCKYSKQVKRVWTVSSILPYFPFQTCAKTTTGGQDWRAHLRFCHKRREMAFMK